jgi:hypothetical protein
MLALADREGGRASHVLLDGGLPKRTRRAAHSALRGALGAHAGVHRVDSERRCRGRYLRVEELSLRAGVIRAVVVDVAERAIYWRRVVYAAA